jgi:hypothetical protein
MDVIPVLALLDKSLVLMTLVNRLLVITKVVPIMKETLSVVKMDVTNVLALLER